MAFVDLSFSCFFNLISDYKIYHSQTDNLGRVVSFIFISALIYHYLMLAEKVIWYPHKITPHERQVILENLRDQELKKEKTLLNLINIIFKLKIILLMACIIMFQTMATFGLSVMLGIQILSFVYLFYNY